MISTENYKFKSWEEYFKGDAVRLIIDVDKTWQSFFDKIFEDNKNLNHIQSELQKTVNKGKNVFPYPELVFSAFKFTKYTDVKVVIIGQDPYFKLEKGIPQAMGLSFSVPKGITVPSSLYNIYKNMIKYKHISSFPKHGNLENWAKQGCLLLNTSLTVEEGRPNSHTELWRELTDTIIKKIASEKKGLVFVLWGAPALRKISLIGKNHHIIVSSHPSGLSCNKPLRNHPAFAEYDHFGKINEYLKKEGVAEIKFD